MLHVDFKKWQCRMSSGSGYYFFSNALYDHNTEKKQV